MGSHIFTVHDFDSRTISIFLTTVYPLNTPYLEIEIFVKILEKFLGINFQ